MQHRSKKEMKGHHFLSPGCLKPYLDIFTDELSKSGFTELTIQNYYNSVAHFATWLQKKNIPLENITHKIISNFAKHHCDCLGSRRTNRISLKYVGRVHRFISYLYQKDIIVAASNPEKILLPSHLIKFKDSLQSRGLAISTIAQYEYSINKLLPLLGANPKKYNAACIRQVICKIAKISSRCEVKKLTTAVRVYLRFLTTAGICRPDLDAAVPTVAEWKLSSLPKYIIASELERVIAACDTRTKQGLRDKAIILLLGRLGLRAGDVSNLRIADINWAESTLCVSGKGRRESLLPLPQDVGDALLAYLGKARPPAPIDKLFLCLNAPYRAFPNSSGISSVVSSALFRAKIHNPPSRGASLLRHSAATNMLRQGATLETVSALLRHQSLDMTGYYAKVDIFQLKKIAQPWPEGAPC